MDLKSDSGQIQSSSSLKFCVSSNVISRDVITLDVIYLTKQGSVNGSGCVEDGTRVRGSGMRIFLRHLFALQIGQRLTQPVEIHLLKIDGEAGDQAEIDILFVIGRVRVGAPARLHGHTSHGQVLEILPVLEQPLFMRDDACSQILYQGFGRGERAKEHLEEQFRSEE